MVQIQKLAPYQCVYISILSSLIPHPNSPRSARGIFNATLHPEAALPFIEVLIPMALGSIGTSFNLGRGGQMSLLLSDQEQNKTFFAGVWDWKKGVCLGVSDPQVVEVRDN